MNLYHLRYFVDAAREGGVSQSARANRLTQSAISRAIAKLESDLGVELVLHRQNRFQLTEAGEAIRLEGLTILEAVARMREVAADHTQTLRGPLRVAGNQAVVSRLIGPVLAEIERRYPDVEPEVKIGNTDQVQRMLDEHEIDVGIVVDDGKVGNVYQRKKLYSGEFIVVKSPTFKSGQVLESIIVSRVRAGGLSQKYGRSFTAAYGRPFKPKLIIPSWQVIMDLAIAGLGCALVPRFLCRDELRANKLEIVRHKVRPIPFELCAIVGKGRAFPKTSHALFELFPSI